jgi:hypothetical protein
MTDYEEWVGEWEERAAIREYDGKMQRAGAERLAFGEISKRLGPPPSDPATGRPTTLAALQHRTRAHANLSSGTR